jgi:AcrR family transcriptional regulator
MSVEAVASRAGVGKATIYRRYEDKTDLVIAALSTTTADFRVPLRSTSRDELIAIARSLAETPPAVALSVTGTLLSEQDESPELLDHFRERVIEPRREVIREVFRRGIERGELRTDTNIELAIDAFTGSFLAAHIARGELSSNWPRAIVETLWQGLSVPHAH